jgi:hypothetical protein
MVHHVWIRVNVCVSDNLDNVKERSPEEGIPPNKFYKRDPRINEPGWRI